MFNVDIPLILLCGATLALLGWLIALIYVGAQFMGVTFFTGV